MRAWVIPTITLLVIGGAGFGAGWAVNEWRDGESVDEAARPTPVKDFSMRLESANDDFREAAEQMQEFMPDFHCSGWWDEERQRGTLGCDAGLTGFSCTLEGRSDRAGVTCRMGIQPLEGYPSCLVEDYSASVSDAEFLRCAGAESDALCQVRRVGDTFEVTCQRA